MINRHRAKPKTKHFKNQIHKRNLNGEGGGTSLTPTEVHARKAEFGSQTPSFGNRRSAVGNPSPVDKINLKTTNPSLAN